VIFTLVGAGYVYVAVTTRARRLAERRAAGIPDDAEPTSGMFVFGEIMRPIILAALAYLALKTTLAYFWLDAQRYLSFFDLAAFNGALAAYGYWLVVKTKCLPLALFQAPAGAEPAAPALPAVAANDCEEVASAGQPARTDAPGRVAA
jgi:hypothetical protein